MRRTRWEAIFAEADRPFLAALHRQPVIVDGPCWLGRDAGKMLESPRCDESRLFSTVHALDHLLHRCADTVRHTDAGLRRWVRGRFLEQPCKALFELVAHERSDKLYRRLLRRCICMWLRLWRLPSSTTRAITGRAITRHQQQAVETLYNDPIWDEWYAHDIETATRSVYASKSVEVLGHERTKPKPQRRDNSARWATDDKESLAETSDRQSDFESEDGESEDEDKYR